MDFREYEVISVCGWIRIAWPHSNIVVLHFDLTSVFRSFFLFFFSSLLVSMSDISKFRLIWMLMNRDPRCKNNINLQ